MANQLGPSPLQISSSQQFDSTMTSLNNLQSLLLVEPYVLEHVVDILEDTKMLGDNYGVTQRVFSDYAKADGRPMYKGIPATNYQWDARFRTLMPIPISGQYTAANSDKPGISFGTFKIPMAEKYFSEGDTVRTESGKLIYIRHYEGMQGSDHCYECQIMTSSAAEYIEPGELESGKLLTMGHPVFPEGSEGGGLKSHGFGRFANTMTIMRYAFSMTASAKMEKIRLPVVATFDGKKENYWLYDQQLMMLKQWNMGMEDAIWNGKLTIDLKTGQGNVFAKNGHIIRSGSGIDEQLNSSNITTVNELTEDVLRDMLMPVCRWNKDADKRRMTIFTGAGGMIAFHKAMVKSMGAVGLVQEAGNFISKLQGNELSYGAQFIEYKGFLGSSVRLVHLPYFDDVDIWPATANNSLHTKKSYEMYFIDSSLYGGRPNVQFFTKEANGESRRFVSWFTSGSTNPTFDRGGAYAPNASDLQKIFNSTMNMRSNGFDGFTAYCLSEFSVAILNPMACGKFIINPNQ